LYLINKEDEINKDGGIYLQIQYTKCRRRVDKCKKFNKQGGRNF
jgi:hypothetical protein